MSTSSLFFNTLTLLCLCSGLAFSQSVPTGGGAYLINSGKISNCIITQNYASNGFGVAGVSGNVTNSNIRQNWYLNKEIVTPGDLIMSDGTVYTPQYGTDKDTTMLFPSGYTVANVVGVCFWTNENNDYLNAKSWVVAVNENASITWTPTIAYNQVDIPSLINFSTPAAAIADKEGFSNTAYIVGYSGFVGDGTGGTYSLTTSNCAAKYCYQYGAVAGVWFLPSLSQLRELSRSLTKINYVLYKLRQVQLATTSVTTISIISPALYWSSTERADYGAWPFNFSTGTVSDQSPKNNLYHARAIKIIDKTK